MDTTPNTLGPESHYNPYLPNRYFSAPGFRWSAVFAGTFFALGIWALLYAFGLAVGLSTVDPNNPASLRPIGTGAGIWSLLVPLIALFLGGLVTSRVAGPMDRTTGALHGAVLWGFTVVVGGIVLGAVVTSLIAGVLDPSALAGQAQRQGGEALQNAPTAGKAFWGLFGVLALSLISSVLGATAGVGRRQRLAAGEVTSVKRPAEAKP